MPRISVITATFNSAAVLPQLMESLRAQSDQGFEWVVVDGGSTDGTVDLLRSAGQLVSDWVSEPDHGIYDALNKGIRRARGDYYLVVGSDDVLFPDAIALYGRAAAASGADVISAPVQVEDWIFRPSRKMNHFGTRHPMVSVHSVGTLIRKALHDELGMYSRRFPIAADADFLLKVTLADKSYAYLEQTVGKFGTQGTSAGDLLGTMSEHMRVNIEQLGWWPLQVMGFILKVMRYAAPIHRQSRKKS